MQAYLTLSQMKWPMMLGGIVPRALSPQLAVKVKDGGKSVRWHLDRARGVATPAEPGEHMKAYSVPLRPMLGCVGVAPGFAAAPVATGDSGRFGGNMDFNEIVEGATVYLPVQQPGALLYFGDAHAAQGDGELTGDALETSMDVEVTVSGAAAAGVVFSSTATNRGGSTTRCSSWCRTMTQPSPVKAWPGSPLTWRSAAPSAKGPAPPC